MKSGISFIIIVIILIVALFFISTIPLTGKEGFSHYNLQEPGVFPESVSLPILNNYKYTGHRNVSNDSMNDIWWYYPSFGVQSYKQITNNLRYRNNPDEGTCSRADFCGALYRNKSHPSNSVFPLPEAQEGPGARVNYYRTEPNLLTFSIPTNENIIYS